MNERIDRLVPFPSGVSMHQESGHRNALMDQSSSTLSLQDLLGNPAL